MSKSEFKLEQRDYQDATVDKVCEYFADHDSVLIESPVGSGKTIMGLRVIKRLEEQFRSQGKTLTVNYVAARRHILWQAQKLNDAVFHCNINFVSAFDHNPPKAEMLLIDEAHHEATQSILNMYDATHNRLTLGLSATPLRTDRMKLSFQRVVRSAQISDLISRGFLSPYHAYKLSNWAPEVIADIYLKDLQRFGKSLVFFRTVEECERFSRLVNAAGVYCEVVTGSSDKERQLEDFLSDKIEVLTNVSVLTEGFDVPELKSVFIRDASRLPTIQMAGRGLRTSPGKEFCNLVQSNNTKYPVEKIAKPAMSFSYFKNSWRSIKDDTRIILDTVDAYRNKIAAYAQNESPNSQEYDASERVEILYRREEQ